MPHHEVTARRAKPTAQRSEPVPPEEPGAPELRGVLDEPMLTVRGVAELLAMTERNVTDLIRRGQLEAYKLPPGYRIPRRAVEQLLLDTAVMTQQPHDEEPADAGQAGEPSP